MRRTLFQFLGFLTTVALFLSACNLPGVKATPRATAQIEPSVTSDMDVIEQFATQTKLVEIAPTDTPTLTLTATETLTPEPSATVTSEPPMAKIVRESNCRAGPGALYKLVAKYQVGQELEIVAKDLGGGYWFVKNPQTPEEQCYLLGQNIKITGDTEALPKFTPPPSPTAPPDVNVSFKKFDTCGSSSFALFVIENAGSVPFRSVYVKVTNQKLGQAVEQSFNAFDLRVHCVLAKNIAPLDPGETGYVASPPFTWPGHGQKLQAVIMVCTEQNLKGACVTKTVAIKE